MRAEPAACEQRLEGLAGVHEAAAPVGVGGEDLLGAEVDGPDPGLQRHRRVVPPRGRGEHDYVVVVGIEGERPDRTDDAALELVLHDLGGGTIAFRIGLDGLDAKERRARHVSDRLGETFRVARLREVDDGDAAPQPRAVMARAAEARRRRFCMMFLHEAGGA